MPIYWEYFKAKIFFVIFVNMGRPGDHPSLKLLLKYNKAGITATSELVIGQNRGQKNEFSRGH